VEMLYNMPAPLLEKIKMLLRLLSNKMKMPYDMSTLLLRKIKTFLKLARGYIKISLNQKI